MGKALGGGGVPYTQEALDTRLTFITLIKKYSALQAAVVCQVRNVASSISAATPGKFLLLQFSMSQVTQVGDSISNLISQVNTMINNSVRNQKTS